MLTPTVRRTWAPVGCTPLVRHHFANERISVISGISVSPTRKRLGLFGMFFWDNIGQDEVVAFLRQVLRHIHGHLIALLDNSSTHKGGPLRICVGAFHACICNTSPPTLQTSIL
ncbi:MAG: hypothetical protein ACLQCB_20210 [Spirochaetia bacterium]